MCGIEIYLSVAKSNCLHYDVRINTTLFHIVLKPSRYSLCISQGEIVGTQQ